MKTPSNILKYIGILFLIILCAQKNLAQCNCTPTGAFPATVNGITISANNTGDVTNYGGNYTSCGISAGPMWVGQNGSFSQTFTFSSPVNNISYVITASSDIGAFSACGGEDFSFTVNSGILTTSQCGTGCPFTQTGNTFCSTGSDDGTIIILNSTSNFTSLTVTGSGGSSGSLVGLCVQSFSSCVAPTLNIAPSYSTCAGTPQTINVSGASTYSWMPGSSLNTTTGDEVIANPTVTTSYTIIGSNGAGCTNTITTTVFVDPIPIPSFTFNTACVGSPTSFTDTSTPTTGANAITNWLWDFDNDGNLDAFTQNPNYTYPTAGIYTANLYAVVLSTGCASNITQTVLVSPTPSVYALNINSECDTTKIDWISFSSVSSGSASGSAGEYSVSVSQSNGGMQPHLGMYGVGNFPTQYSVATITNAIANYNSGLFTFCFNEPVINPQVSLSSIGQSGLQVPVNTSVPYEVVWNGLSMQYPSNTQFIGEEGYTILRFPGIHTCLSFDYLVTESYCTVAFGLMDAACQKSIICPNEPVVFLAKGASTYTWNTGATTSTVLVTPTSNAQYTVTGANNFGCSNTATISVDVYTINPISVNSASICMGQQTATLSSNGAVTYTWDAPSTLSNSTGSIVIASPNSTTAYTITATDINECVQTATTQVLVYSLPNVLASTNTLCAGASATITALGATTYTWDSSASLNSATGATVVANPTITTNYTVTGTDANGCTNFTTTAVVVNPLPTISVTNNTICIGKAGDLIASGANTYTWNASTTLNSNTGTTVTANPITTTNYSVTGVDGNGCVNTQTTSVTVNNLPNVTVTPSFSMCSTNTGTLIANGASSYTWFPTTTLSAISGSVVNANPIATETYIVIGEDAVTTCTNTAITTISVTTTPTVSVVATSTLLCPQQSATLTASGATTYVWLPFMTQGNSVIASPTTNTTYTVIGANGSCTNTAEIAITATVNPTISVTTETICSGTSANLTASGATSYTWSPTTFLNTNFNSTVISTTPNSMLYSVTGASPLGCKSTETVMVSVVSTPTINVVGNPLTICSGSTTVVTANGASSYTWFPAASLDNANTANPTASPSVTTTYVVVGSNGLGNTLCVNNQSITIRVLPKIQPLLSVNDEICEGQSTKIYAKGGNVYQWSPTATALQPNDSTTIVKPSATTIYTVVVSINNLCPQTGTVQVSINPLPLVDAGRDSTINIDESIVLQGTGNVPVGFLSPDGNPLVCNWCSVVEVFPKEKTCYVLEGITDKGCKATDEVCITVTKDWDVYIPNAFTPNGDLPNEYFLPQGYGITQIDLEIFNRWGTSIFKEENTTLGWDGYSKGMICEQGVYVYRVTIKSMNGETNYRVGHVTLLLGKKK